jgi:hypothetical protein
MCVSCVSEWLQALNEKQLLAMAGAADGSKVSMIALVASVKMGAIKGDRCAQSELLDFHEVEAVTNPTGQTVGLTYEVGQTKVDRVRQSDTKSLQCASDCIGKLTTDDKGRIDLAAVCPVHLVLHVRRAWAEYLGVEPDALLSCPMWADYERFENLKAGDTLSAQSEESPAYRAKPKAAVKIVTRETEVTERYLGGGETLTDGSGRECRPRVGREFLIVCMEFEFLRAGGGVFPLAEGSLRCVGGVCVLRSAPLGSSLVGPRLGGAVVVATHTQRVFSWSQLL